MLDCVTQCSQSAAYLYEVQEIGFVTLGLLCGAQSPLPRVVLLQHGVVVLVGFKPDLNDQLVSFSFLALLV